MDHGHIPNRCKAPQTTQSENGCPYEKSGTRSGATVEWVGGLFLISAIENARADARARGPATQKQALNALIFLARHVYQLDDMVLDFRPSVGKRRRMPTVLTREEVVTILSHLSEPWKLIAEIMYGSGMRQMEVLGLRVKDVDFGHMTLHIQDGKGGKSRAVPLPQAIEQKLEAHLEQARTRHAEDAAIGLGAAHLPESLGRNTNSQNDSVE